MAHFWNSVLLMARSACHLHHNHCSFFPSFCLFFSFLFFSFQGCTAVGRGGVAGVWRGWGPQSEVGCKGPVSVLRVTDRAHTHTHKELRLPHTRAPTHTQSDEEESGCVQQHYRVLMLSPRRWKRTQRESAGSSNSYAFCLKSMHNIWGFIML